MNILLTMETFVSHISAALSWDIPYLQVVLDNSLVDEHFKASEQKEHLCSATRHKKSKSSSCITHYKSLPLPAKSVLAFNGKLLASPELVFLDLSQQLGFHRAVLLGMQLCSSTPNGHPPLTSAKKLRDYLAKCKKLHGYKAANLAAKYVADNSWSIMESLLYMFLTLPNQHGGYGLKGAALNFGIRLKTSGEHQKVKQIYADLFWEHAKLVVEYDSYQHHNNKNMWIKDARRASFLERNGYKVFSINTAQIYDCSAFDDVARALARHLGQRIQIRSNVFYQKRQLLRSLLPSPKKQGLDSSSRLT